MWKTKVKQWSGLIITVCITLAVFLGMKFSMPFVYSVNDDRFARDILSGAYTGTPDGHIEHMRYLICLPLCILFRIFPGVDWYAVMLFVIHGLCFFLVLYQLAKGIKTWYGKLLVWLIFVEIFSYRFDCL